MCSSEGSELAYIESQEIQDGIAALIAKKQKTISYFSNAIYFWLGAKVTNGREWSWLNYFRYFTEYMYWESKKIGKCNISNNLTLK